MRPRQIFMTLGPSLLGEFKPDKKRLFYFIFYLFSAFIVPTLGLALGLPIILSSPVLFLSITDKCLPNSLKTLFSKTKVEQKQF